jgi:hypothetical protein
VYFAKKVFTDLRGNPAGSRTSRRHFTAKLLNFIDRRSLFAGGLAKVMIECREGTGKNRDEQQQCSHAELKPRPREISRHA